ncbi:hypothetical protein CDD82_7484 [Ophiocordyceps australis]|uniref:Uncharacterized protein n=1 Tax=Ophiocordyceps australis TaxID=1399860 RepID=A0A2C5ZIY9_9HYPO|nr:hypothetical protein CDD82_7484 [Ophiocordyceps australis]
MFATGTAEVADGETREHRLSARRDELGPPGADAESLVDWLPNGRSKSQHLSGICPTIKGGAAKDVLRDDDGDKCTQVRASKLAAADRRRS